MMPALVCITLPDARGILRVMQDRERLLVTAAETAAVFVKPSTLMSMLAM